MEGTKIQLEKNLQMLNNFIEKLLGLFTGRVFASTLADDLSGTVTEDELNSINSSTEFVNWIIKISIPLGVTCAFVLLVYAGFMMVTSQGNPDKLKESREVITNAIIGFVVVVLAVTILYLIKDTLGLSF